MCDWRERRFTHGCASLLCIVTRDRVDLDRIQVDVEPTQTSLDAAVHDFMHVTRACFDWAEKEQDDS